MTRSPAREPASPNGGTNTGRTSAPRYGDALRALRALRNGYDDRAAMELKDALEGDEFERAFQQFLTEPESTGLLRSRPELADTLDDLDALSALPEDSLGRAYRGLAIRDGIRARDLVATEAALAADRGDVRDPARAWLRARLVASHDLLHVLTDYERDEPGELLLIAFTHAFAPQRVLPIGFALGLLGAPASRLPAFLRDALRAWCRGRRARIRCSTPWEQLLRLPTAEARVLLGIADTAHAHRGRIWRRISDGGPWARVPIVEGRRVTDRNPAPARRCSTATWEPTSPSSPPSR